ncbi:MULTISPECIES: IS66 family insertion sequence element accessory protein TnpB [unclassified Ectothiorhodospira]|uniref:IS66 family insertion sequence element accessory protein TnpB n=1 Tax=unclassified Ectothiorhodospira TaxID=2684909 RepID=UPI001EE8B4C9|nr:MULTISPECIES: IS66 family insertion sequence element accessory protein TnpB [unclassified Ectothiorhodospira]MCG5517410.1 IS66 family insertion sequence element accessory protein TnpB [Ectothiorhodospira sp. 9100]MCG5520321.1 IS66 family insertion sequence element accessory protein TnpB [Ectothiorhodospira sp. 9905]
MLRPLPRLWLCTQPTDMRRSYDGLVALVKQHLGMDPLSGQGFIFINRRRTQLKVLYFDEDGYCLWCKRLEQGRFRRLGDPAQAKVALSQTEFSALIEGLQIAVEKRQKRWRNRPFSEGCMVQ